MVKRTFLALAAMVWAVATAGMVTVGGRAATADEHEGRVLASEDGTGLLRTVSVRGPIDLDNPFFQDLGTNGRRCVSCHQADAAWTITPANVQARFRATHGTDPIFANNDGSNCEGALPQTVQAKQAAYSLLLTRGLIRIGLDVPAGAEFVIERIDDPNHCGPASNDASLYRRPLPSTNLRFLSAVMWEGRESSSTTTIEQDLLHQANDATRGHAQASVDLTASQAQQIVDFETGLFTAQAVDRDAGSLHAEGALGGPGALSAQPFFIGINDPVGLNPTGAAFNPKAFTIFDAWARLARGRGNDDHGEQGRRAAVARGQALFNTKPITITGVSGLNGQTFSSGVTVPASFVGNCTTCHDSPNAGDHSVKAPLNIGLTDPAIAPYLPVYTLRNVVTQETVQTTDPGRAMISGKWQDVGRFKGPILRALAARAPYFHNGSAATFEEVIAFYEQRFHIGFTASEKADLIAFLRSL